MNWNIEEIFHETENYQHPVFNKTLDRNSLRRINETSEHIAKEILNHIENWSFNEINSWTVFLNVDWGTEELRYKFVSQVASIISEGTHHRMKTWDNGSAFLWFN